ncbi:MAG: SpoIIE family protein phosphatase [Clostridiales bacterium]|nr:SpoIIE family protein phosphatase [Clostridiales bacterium]
MKRLRFNIKAKFTCASILLAAALFAGLTAVSYICYKNSMVRKDEEIIRSLVRTAAALVPAGDVSRYLETLRKDEGYDRLREQFQILQRENGLEFLYSYRPDAGGFTTFVEGGSEDSPFYGDLGAWFGTEDYSVEDIALANRLFRGKSDEAVIVTRSKYGYLVSALEVVRDGAGEPVVIVGADMSMDKIQAELSRYLWVVLELAFGIIGAFVTAYLSLLRENIIDPLQQLVNSAVKFVDSKGTEERLRGIKVRVRTGDEIEDLARAFNKMTDDIIHYIAEIESSTRERERTATELRVAALIQEGMLPRDFSFCGWSEFEVFASTRAAQDVGGDFYDVFTLGLDKLCVVVGDVSGKGVPAALFMAMAKATVRDRAWEGANAGEILREANDALCRGNEQGMFVTVHISLLNLRTGELEWSDAGHIPPILISGGRAEPLAGKKGFVAGCEEGYKYVSNRAKMSPGDVLYVYTDGVSEAANERLEMYGGKRLRETLARLGRRLKPPEPREICEAVTADVDRFAEGCPQFDDITMLALLYKGSAT